MPEVKAKRPDWGLTACYGAELGVSIALLYALAFTGYASVRSTFSLLTTPDVDAGLAVTLFTTWLSLIVPAVGIAAMLMLPVAVIGALTALLLRGVTMLSLARIPSRGLVLSGAMCTVLSITTLGLPALYTRADWTPAMVETLTFWLIIPMLLYIVAGALAGREMVCMLGPAPREHVEKYQPTSASGG
jgi:hypothetical protein